MTKQSRRSFTSGAATMAAAIALLTVLSTADAKPPYFADWEAVYPDSQSGDNVMDAFGTSCALCHASPGGGNPWNAYGWQLRTAYEGGATILEAIMAAEPIDSDLDPTGTSNLGEIEADTQPGWTPGTNNTFYNEDNTTVPNQLPPSGILGLLDPGGGACCLPDGTCVASAGSGECAALGGAFQGELTTCGGTSCPPPCVGDIDNSGVVDFIDLVTLLSSWGACVGCPADLNGDGVVDFIDLLTVLSAWGNC